MSAHRYLPDPEKLKRYGDALAACLKIDRGQVHDQTQIKGNGEMLVFYVDLWNGENELAYQTFLVGCGHECDDGVRVAIGEATRTMLRGVPEAARRFFDYKGWETELLISQKRQDHLAVDKIEHDLGNGLYGYRIF